jgi:hypothetical protein
MTAFGSFPRWRSHNASVGKRPTFIGNRPTSVAKKRHKNSKPSRSTQIKNITGSLAGALSGVKYGY